MAGKPTVIIADDSKLFRMYFSILLSRMNFEVLPVENGQEALGLARVIAPHIIAIDVQTTGPSGLETLQQIRNDKKLTNMPVIMISNQADQAEECFATGCNDFLAKPINLEHLHTALQKCHRRREGMRQHLRAPFNSAVRYFADGKQVDSHASTLSEGGIYLHTRKPLPLGSRLEIDIPLGEKESMRLCGEVIYRMDRSRGNLTLPPGMAIRFDDCAEEISRQLNQEVKRLLAGDIMEVQGQTWFSHD